MATQGTLSEISGNVEHSACPGRLPPITGSASSRKIPPRNCNTISSPSRELNVKLTLNASSKSIYNSETGKTEFHVNQYVIKEEIGRGSFSAVHRSIDQNGNEYAIKEFSKSKLKKRAQLDILKQSPHNRKSTYPLPFRRSSGLKIQSMGEYQSPLCFIRKEIEIMRKLNHPNLARLIEVLDDPDEDSLYMVLELCKKGIVMKIGLDEKACPFSLDTCRHWFRHLILGVEYLHAQRILHRDIKPDNLLLTEDNVLKIVDFGASEIFEKDSDMMTSKSVGSPAFLPPELCVTNHGYVLGTAVDIWSLGVSLYCLRFGHLPFEHTSILELFEAIKNTDVELETADGPEFNHLMSKILEKDPHKRIKMDELRSHPWVTKNGTDPLPENEQDTANVESQALDELITFKNNRIKSVSSMMKTVKKLKGALEKKQNPVLSEPLTKNTQVMSLNPLASNDDYKSLPKHMHRESSQTDAEILNSYPQLVKPDSDEQHHKSLESKFHPECLDPEVRYCDDSSSCGSVQVRVIGSEKQSSHSMNSLSPIFTIGPSSDSSEPPRDSKGKD
ncbi:Calcium/calmodulin-dependent protein kinase kinase [Podosphaera aphanis]|nr:Calcium/calmodulin-dependent protein kinase kinase [Podosphaera aphanis]